MEAATASSSCRFALIRLFLRSGQLALLVELALVGCFTDRRSGVAALNLLVLEGLEQVANVLKQVLHAFLVTNNLLQRLLLCLGVLGFR